MKMEKRRNLYTVFQKSLVIFKESIRNLEKDELTTLQFFYVMCGWQQILIQQKKKKKNF